MCDPNDWTQDEIDADQFRFEHDECDHMDYELDILTGRAECPTCGYRWFMNDAELKRDQEWRQMPYPGDEEQGNRDE